MNGPQHYREAERLMRVAHDLPDATLTVAAAQVHATLALTAALMPPGKAWAEATRREGDAT